MTPTPYSFELQYSGDSFLGAYFQLKDEDNITPIDITNYRFLMQIKTCERGRIIKELSNGSGITIINAINGEFQIDSFIVPHTSGQMIYDLEITYPNNLVDTYIRGFFAIIQDISR